ncbi:MAG: hypothetical protein ACREX9_07235 [Gammaproteobacteria bacterium]
MRSRGLERRVLEARTGPCLQDAGAGLTTAPRGVKREHVRILAAVTAARGLGTKAATQAQPPPQTADGRWLAGGADGVMERDEVNLVSSL